MAGSRKKRVVRPDGTWFHENVRPARQTANRKPREAEALARRLARKDANRRLTNMEKAS